MVSEVPNAFEAWVLTWWLDLVRRFHTLPRRNPEAELFVRILERTSCEDWNALMCWLHRHRA